MKGRQQERLDRQQLEAAKAILANPNAIPLQTTWARAIVARYEGENGPNAQVDRGDGLGRLNVQGTLPLGGGS